MTTNRSSHDDDQSAESSPTAHLLDELQLYGHRPFDDEPDPRPLPDPKRLHGALADIFDALVATLADTRLESDLPDLLWSVVNLFHRRIGRIERALDTNETEQRHSQRDQDGSEIRSVELTAPLPRPHAHRTPQQLRVHARCRHPSDGQIKGARCAAVGRGKSIDRSQSV